MVRLVLLLSGRMISESGKPGVVFGFQCGECLPFVSFFRVWVHQGRSGPDGNQGGKGELEAEWPKGLNGGTVFYDRILVYTYLAK